MDLLLTKSIGLGFLTREKVKPWSKANIVMGDSSLPQISLCWLTVVYMVSYKQP